MREFLLVVIALAVLPATAPPESSLSFGQQSSLPDWVAHAVQTAATGDRYAVCPCLNPFYQRGDFDGDGKVDYAVLATDRRSGKRGVLIVHRRDQSVHVVGAGISVGAGGDDFSWMDAWQVYERGPVARGAGGGSPPALKGDALVLEKTEAASGLVWWDGGATTGISKATSWSDWLPAKTFKSGERPDRMKESAAWERQR